LIVKVPFGKLTEVTVKTQLPLPSSVPEEAVIEPPEVIVGKFAFDREFAILAVSSAQPFGSRRVSAFFTRATAGTFALTRRLG
jgi:hypothetical protein